MDLCLYADVYGFSAMVRRDLDATAESLKTLTKRCVALVESRKRTASGHINLQFFSDNLMLVLQPKSSDPGVLCDCLEEFIILCADLYYESILTNLPLRGAIGVGNLIVLEGQFLGVPVIEAVEIEKQIRLPFIFITEQMIDRTRSKCHNHRIEQLFTQKPIDIPFGDGVLSALPIIPADTHALTEFAKGKYRSYRLSPGTAKPAKDWFQVAKIVAELTGS